MTVEESSVLRDVLASVSARMLADFNASGIARHRGSKGTVREAQFLGNFLRKYLPRNVVAEHSGEVVATDRQVSGQCDVLILDPSTPPFWDEEDYRIVPVECVHGVIEVKSFLDPGELTSAWKKTARLKAFPKTAYHPSPLTWTRQAYGRSWPYIPTVGMVFAYDGSDINTLGATLEELAKDEAPEHRLDSVWVLNKGYLNWISPTNGKLDMSPEPGAGLMAIESTAKQMLLPLISHLYNHFATAWMPPLRIEDYMPGDWGTAGRVWLPAVKAVAENPTDTDG